MVIVLESTNLNELWIEMVEQILENISVFQIIGSGWTFHSIVSLDIHTEKYKPWRVGSWVPTPKFLANKKALVNMKFQSEKKKQRGQSMLQMEYCKNFESCKNSS